MFVCAKLLLEKSFAKARLTNETNKSAINAELSYYYMSKECLFGHEKIRLVGRTRNFALCRGSLCWKIDFGLGTGIDVNERLLLADLPQLILVSSFTLRHRNCEHAYFV